MSDHAIYAPSSASVWGRCSGSIIAAQAAPSPETEQTRTGTAAHWVASESLEAWKAGGLLDLLAFVGQTAPNGVVIDRQMVDSVEVYVRDVIDTLAPFGPDGKAALLVEHRVHMPAIHPDNWGTLDAAAQIGNRIYIWDYKHGHGKVDAFENLQLVDYLEGLRHETGINGHGDQLTEIDARVIQPNAYSPDGPVSQWRAMLCDIRALVTQLHDKAHEDPTLTSGPHCRYCPARGRCPALRQAAYNLIDQVNSPLAFDSMCGADLATERAILQRGQTMLKARLEAIEDDLTHRVKNGDASCGLALDSVPGRLNWSVDPRQAIAALGLFGVDISRPHCDTPTQARTRLPAEMRPAFDSAVKSITKRNFKLSLIDASDTLAARVFKK